MRESLIQPRRQSAEALLRLILAAASFVFGNETALAQPVYKEPVTPDWAAQLSNCKAYAVQGFDCDKMIANAKVAWKSAADRERTSYENSIREREARERENEAREAARVQQRRAAEKAVFESSRLEAATTAYAAIYVGRRQPLAVASAELCRLRGIESEAEESIRSEKAAAKISGVVDKEVLYEAGHSLAEVRPDIKAMVAAIKRVLKKSPLPCKGAVSDLVWQLVCSPNDQECEGFMGNAIDFVIDAFNGDVGRSAEEREVEARSAINDDRASLVEAYERRLAASLAGKPTAQVGRQAGAK